MFETLITLFVFLVGGALASYFVSKHVHAPMRAASAGEEDFVLDHEFTYLDELEGLERRPLDKAARIALGKRYAVDEDTPCGRVAMTYAHEDGRFEYWSERNHIPYKTLDAVARKFCVENDCKALHVDMYEALYKQWAASRQKAVPKGEAVVSPCGSGPDKGGGSGRGSGSSEDDYTHLFGREDDDDDDARSGREDDDEGGEADSLLASFVRSPGRSLDDGDDGDDGDMRSGQDGQDGQDGNDNGGDASPLLKKRKREASSASTSSVFASFKDYNAPVRAIAQQQQQQQQQHDTNDKEDDREPRAAGDLGDTEPAAPTQNTFLRRGSMHDWEAMCAKPKAKGHVTRAEGEGVLESLRPLSYAAFKALVSPAATAVRTEDIEMQPLLPKEDHEGEGEGEKEETVREEGGESVPLEGAAASALFDRLF